jgi:hypothetical protein
MLLFLVSGAERVFSNDDKTLNIIIMVEIILYLSNANWDWIHS